RHVGLLDGPPPEDGPGRAHLAIPLRDAGRALEAHRRLVHAVRADGTLTPGAAHPGLAFGMPIAGARGRCPLFGGLTERRRGLAHGWVLTPRGRSRPATG